MRLYTSHVFQIFPFQVSELPPSPAQNYREPKYCFLCEHTHHRIHTSNPYDEDDVQSLTDQLKSILNEWAGSHRVETAVQVAYDFYEQRIRAVHTYLPEWTKGEIHNHVVYHTQDTAMGVMNVLSILESQISALHSVSWVRNADSGEPLEPNLPAIRTIQGLVRTYYDGVRLRKGTGV